MNKTNRRRKASSFSNIFSTSPLKHRSAKPSEYRATALNANAPTRDAALKPSVPAPKQASALYLFLFVTAAALVCAGLIYHLQLRFEGVRLGYATSRARAEQARLVAEQRELRLELSSLKSPERIETEAREKLSMKMPENDQIVSMGKKAAPVLASGRAR
jgi:cell division protein FtsL